METQPQLLDMQVAAENAISSLELTESHALAGIVPSRGRQLSPEVMAFNKVLIKASVEASLLKAQLLQALGLPLSTKLTAQPKTES